MIELMLVEGVTDVQLISYYLQNVYGWIYQKNNSLGVNSLDKQEHIESLYKDNNQLVLCGVGGIGKFKSFIKKHRINEMLINNDIASVFVVTDRDNELISSITRRINDSFDKVSFSCGKWKNNNVKDLFDQEKEIMTYLLIIPSMESGALEKVIIQALKDMPNEKRLIQEIETFINVLRMNLLPDLNKQNNESKAQVGTYFSVRYPKNAMRPFAVFVSKIKWSDSQSLNNLFSSFQYLGKIKPIDN